MDSKKKSSIYDLPDKILENIFHKLPIKTLGLCLCITKQWSRLIINPRFIRANEMIKSATNRFSIIYNCESHCFDMYTDNHDKFQLHSHLNFPVPEYEYEKYEYKKGTVETTSASCNGLLCIGKPDDHGTVILWNPIIRKVLTLPQRHYDISPFLGIDPLPLQILGLGYHSLTGDYKVIRILQFKQQHSIVEFFSLKTYSWKMVSPRAPYFLNMGGIACSNGDIHWVNHGHYMTILDFTASTEVFREIQAPRFLDPTKWAVSLTTHQQFTIALICNRDALVVWDEYEVWVMKEYGDEESWSNMFTLKLDSLRTSWQTEVGCSEVAWSEVWGLRYEGDMLLRVNLLEPNVDFGRSLAMSIDTKTGEKKYLQVTTNSDGLDFESNFIRYFEENLTLLDCDRAVSIPGNNQGVWKGEVVGESSRSMRAMEEERNLKECWDELKKEQKSFYREKRLFYEKMKKKNKSKEKKNSKKKMDAIEQEVVVESKKKKKKNKEVVIEQDVADVGVESKKKKKASIAEGEGSSCVKKKKSKREELEDKDNSAEGEKKKKKKKKKKEEEEE